jgi:hypothetical protein
MRRSWLAVPAVAVVAMGCTAGAAPLRPARNPVVYTGTPPCDYTILGTFAHSSNILREVQLRGGDAAILVNEDTGTMGNDRVSPHYFSGTVVRFNGPACKGQGSHTPVNGR